MSLFGRVASLLALTPLLLVLVADPAHADPTFATGVTAASPNPVAPGVTITITTSVTNTSPALASGIIVDEEIYDTAGVKVNQGTPSGQQYTPGQTFQAGETLSYQWFWTIPATLPAAQYTIKIGVFQDHWSRLYTWNNDAARFTVQSSGATIAFGMGGITATPTAIQPGQIVTIASQVTNTGTAAASGINVLFELRDPFGQPFPGNQQSPPAETFAPGQTKAYSFQFAIPASATQGVYSASVAVFDSSWTLRYAWKGNAEAFTVGTAVDPTFVIGAPTVSPGTVTGGQTVGITVPVTDSGGQPAVETIVDVEIRDAADAKVLQQYVDNQAFAAGERLQLRVRDPVDDGRGELHGQRRGLQSDVVEALHLRVPRRLVPGLEHRPRRGHALGHEGGERDRDGFQLAGRDRLRHGLRGPVQSRRDGDRPDRRTGVGVGLHGLVRRRLRGRGPLPRDPHRRHRGHRHVHAGAATAGGSDRAQPDRQPRRPARRGCTARGSAGLELGARPAGRRDRLRGRRLQSPGRDVRLVAPAGLPAAVPGGPPRAGCRRPRSRTSGARCGRRASPPGRTRSSPH